MGFGVNIDWIISKKLIAKLNANIQQTKIDNYYAYNQNQEILGQLGQIFGMITQVPSLAEDVQTAAINDPLNYTFSSSLLAAKWNDRMDIMGDLIAMMASNNYFGRINLVGNAGVMNLLNKLMEHGTYNDVNKAYEYLDKMLWLTSNVSNASNKYCTGYAIPDGHVGIIEKLPRTCLAGEEANGHVWGKTTLPLMGDLQFGTHFYSTVGDYSTETGESDMVCDIADYYGFELNFALLNSYRSVVADPTPVIKWNIATGDNGVYYTEAVQ